MEPLDINPGNRLTWSQPKALERTFELRDGNRLFGSLSFVKSFGSLAGASLATGDWTFKRVGYFRPRVTVRRRGQETDLAFYEPKGLGIRRRVAVCGRPHIRMEARKLLGDQVQLCGQCGEDIGRFQAGGGREQVVGPIQVSGAR